MKNYCDHCDPNLYVIYGYCWNCKRKCECPLFDCFNEEGYLDLIEYIKFKEDWDGEN